MYLKSIYPSPKIKDIRFILKKGDDFHIDSMLKTKYTLTSIRNMI